MTGVDALSVACPSCGAVVGDRCWSGTRRGRKFTRGSHSDRIRAARGEDVPESFSAFLRREIRRVEDEVLSRKKP
jgi:hypothetical protein